MADPSGKPWDRAIAVVTIVIAASSVLATVSDRFVHTLAVGWLLTGAAAVMTLLAGKEALARRAEIVVLVIFTVGTITSFGIAVHRPQANVTRPYCDSGNPAGSSPPLLVRPQAGRASLAIDKVAVQEERSAGLLSCLSMDVTLRSSGTGVQVVDLAEIKVIKIWNLPFSCTFGGKGGGGVPISDNYQSIVNLDEAPADFSLDQLDEQLNGNDTDRFTVTAKLEKAPTAEVDQTATLVEAQLDVYSDDGQEPLSTGPFIFSAMPDVDPQNLLYAGSDTRDLTIARDNAAELREIAHQPYPTTANSKNLEGAATLADALGPGAVPRCPY